MGLQPLRDGPGQQPGGGVHTRVSVIFSTNDTLANLGVIVAGGSCGRLGPHASEPSGPWVVGRWPVLTQMVQPASLQGRCTLPGGLRSQPPAG
jgi:hypothetical protein